jgi:hypothetical protein
MAPCRSHRSSNHVPSLPGSLTQCSDHGSFLGTCPGAFGASPWRSLSAIKRSGSASRSSRGLSCVPDTVPSFEQPTKHTFPALQPHRRAHGAKCACPILVVLLPSHWHSTRLARGNRNQSLFRVLSGGRIARAPLGLSSRVAVCSLCFIVLCSRRMWLSNVEAGVPNSRKQDGKPVCSNLGNAKAPNQ